MKNSPSVTLETGRPDHMRYDDISIAIGIASAGRADVLRQTVDHLRLLRPAPTRLVICVPDRGDATGLEAIEGVEVVVSPRGLTTQRNCLLRTVSGSCDILVFLDDDFLPATDYLLHINRAFAADSQLLIATGHVLADGILTGGLSVSDALDVINAPFTFDERVTEVYNAYGCNMAVRLAPIIEHGFTFDEALPLYGWLEDVDFSRIVARKGRSAMVWAARGVHLGVKSGRQSGLKLGYSQVANPVYLMGKRTMAPSRALAQIGRNVLANIRGYLIRDRSIDRRGRLLGNLRAMADLLTRRSSPLRILELERPRELKLPLSAPASDGR